MKNTGAFLVLPLFLLSACGMFSKNQEVPSPDLNDHLGNSEWMIQSVDLHLKSFRGRCDFQKIHPNSIQATATSSNEGSGLMVHRLSDSEPDGCRFEVATSGHHFSPANHLGGIFEFQVLGVSTIQFSYEVGHLAPVRAAADKDQYLRDGWVPVFEQKRMIANETPFVIQKQKLPGERVLTAHCARFETNGRISSRKKVVTCFLPEHQGTIRLEEK